MERKKSSSADMSFDEFKEKYGKKYKNEDEENKRRQIYDSNVEALETLRESRSYAVGVNHLSDMNE